MNLKRILRTLGIRRQRNVEIRIDQWRRDKALVQDTAKFLSTPVGQALLDMLQNGSPIEYSIGDTGISAEDRSFHLAKILGYQLCLRRLVLSAVHEDEPQGELVPTFEPPEER